MYPAIEMQARPKYTKYRFCSSSAQLPDAQPRHSKLLGSVRTRNSYVSSAGVLAAGRDIPYAWLVVPIYYAACKVEF